MSDRLFSVKELEAMLDPAHAEKLYRAFEISLASQLLDTIRWNEQLCEMLDHMRQVFTERDIPNKDSDDHYPNARERQEIEDRVQQSQNTEVPRCEGHKE